MIKGDFELALYGLIFNLQNAEGSGSYKSFASDLLCKWDITRGEDWFTGTKKRDEEEFKISFELFKGKVEDILNE